MHWADTDSCCCRRLSARLCVPDRLPCGFGHTLRKSPRCYCRNLASFRDLCEATTQSCSATAPGPWPDIGGMSGARERGAAQGTYMPLPHQHIIRHEAGFSTRTRSEKKAGRQDCHLTGVWSLQHQSGLLSPHIQSMQLQERHPGRIHKGPHQPDSSTKSTTYCCTQNPLGHGQGRAAKSTLCNVKRDLVHAGVGFSTNTDTQSICC